MVTIATLRARWHGFAGTFAALTLGVALMAATALVLLAAAPTVPARYANASVLVRSPDPGADPAVSRRPWSQSEASDLAARIAHLDGVVAAVPDPSFYAQALIGGKPAGKPQGELDGHGFSTLALASFGLRSGQAPAGSGEIVVDEVLGVRAGDPVTILTAAGPRRFTVSGTVDGPGEYPAGYWVSDAEAARLAGGVRVIGVRAAAGADVTAAVRQAVGDRGEVLSGDALSKAEPVADAKLRWITTQILSAMAILAGFTTVFVVASTFAFGVHQRRREFALLRA
ncbi:MAG: putative transport system permease protein, partial [Cryptosporangiaceae bacterium]|nr:putative transport system permease protein [Cryptosporangiaceae bacterium]